MIKDFQTYISEGLFDRNQSEFVIARDIKGNVRQYEKPNNVFKSKEEILKTVLCELAFGDTVDLTNCKINELRHQTFSLCIFDGNGNKIISDEDLFELQRMKHIKLPYSSNSNDNYTLCSRCFCGLKNLETVDIGQSVSIIGNSAFSGCESIKELTIPSSVLFIFPHAFFGCTSLKKLNIVVDENVFNQNKKYMFLGGTIGVEIGKDISTFNFGKFCKITDLSNDCEVVFIDKNNHQP